MTTKRQRLGITKKYRGYPKRATYLLNPLYQDELGQSFDEKHRVNIMDFVKNLSSDYIQKIYFYFSIKSIILGSLKTK